MRYVHMFLFECTECNCPIPSAQITDHQLEAADAMMFDLRCDQCGKSSQALGHTARRHFVSDWDSRRFNQYKTQYSY
jgi:hypothetical protein